MCISWTRERVPLRNLEEKNGFARTTIQNNPGNIDEKSHINWDVFGTGSRTIALRPGPDRQQHTRSKGPREVFSKSERSEGKEESNVWLFEGNVDKRYL